MPGIELLKASAGSGKTFQLAYRYIRMVVAEPTGYRSILAVTFTNKATEEMKRRILSELDKLAREEQTVYALKLAEDLGYDPERIASGARAALSNILHDYSRFAVLTIDKFFQRIIRSFLKEIGIDLNFNLELQTDTLLSAAANILTEDIAVNADLRKWLEEYIEERIEEGKKWDVKAGLTELGSELFTEAYKSSRKDTPTAEVYREFLREHQAAAQSVLAGIKKTAGQAMQRIAERGLSVTDFSGGSRSFARYFEKCALGEVGDFGTAVEKALQSTDAWVAKTSPRKSEIIEAAAELQPLLCSICDSYRSNKAMINTVALLRRNYRTYAMLSDLERKIAQLCREENIMPISETNEILGKLIAGNDTPFVFEKAGNHYDRFMIDEFQDTSAMQWSNFVPLIRNALAQAEESPAFIVGDVKQSIYRWRGGDWQIFSRKIQESFDGVTSATMDVNYRSAANIVNFNNRLIDCVIARSVEAISATISSARQNNYVSEEFAAEVSPLLETAYGDHSQKTGKNSDEGYISVTVYPDGDNSFEQPLIAAIEDLQSRGFLPGQIAILVRYNSEGVRIANALLEYKNSNPQSPFVYDVVTQEALLIGSAPVSAFVISVLKLAGDPGQVMARAVWNDWFEREVHEEFTPEDIGFLDSIRNLSAVEAFDLVVRRFDLGRQTENIPYLQALLQQIIDYQRSRIGDIAQFVAWWDEAGYRQSVHLPANEQAITISSIHKAKGLEYKAVIVPFCNWRMNPSSKTVLWARGAGEYSRLGTVPVYYSEKMRESCFAEDYYRESVMTAIDNINLLYVAATRAVTELHLMMPEQKKKGGAGIDNYVIGALESMFDDSPGSLQVFKETQGELIHYTFGQKYVSAPVGQSSAIRSTPYNTYPIENRLRLKRPSFLRAGEEGDIAKPIDYGIYMHSVFQNSETIKDIAEAIDDLKKQGKIDEAIHSAMIENAHSALDDPLIETWFDGSWDFVRNESDILIPGTLSVRRPDRVMIRGDIAVVVDYKFGSNMLPGHKKQLQDYANVLKNMGYKSTEAYLWYFSLGQVIRVE